MSADPNRLLFVISARACMTWADYCEAVEFLSSGSLGINRITDITATMSGLLQCLVALGHCDNHYENGQSTITIAPPAICRIPRSGLPIAFLAGARCLKTQEQLADAEKKHKGAIQITTKRHPGPLGLMPDTILIESKSEDALIQFSTDLGLHYSEVPPTWSLVNWCGSLSEYEKTLDYCIPKELGWTRYDFCLSSQKFIRQHSEFSIRYSRYLDPTTKLPLHVFFQGDLGAKSDLCWGRYLFLNAKNITVAAYDEKRFRLCVPVKTPFPAIVARTVCLCSGKPPIHISRESLVTGLDCRDWLMFEGVPPQIAIIALSRVGQNPVRVAIK